MENLYQYFSSETIKKLEILKSDLQNTEAFSDAERHELFRTLHTVKGSSQTFGFTTAGRLAHELENLLVAGREDFFANEKIKILFIEGICLLIESLQEKNLVVPTLFIEKVRGAVFRDAQPPQIFDGFIPEIPAEISSQLSNQEKSALISFLNGGKTLYVFEIGFEMKVFAKKFKEFREVLNDLGDVVATLPSPKFNQSGKVGFQIVLASILPVEQIRKTAESSRAELIPSAIDADFSSDLPEVLTQTVKHGKTIAEKLGKKIEFAISADETELTPARQKLVFDSLIHLIRNAIDHASEDVGKIEIALKIEENHLKLSVSDTGRGIDLEKVKAKAVEKNLISSNRHLSEQETLDLIFLPEFSTASKVTEISGRGVGLDAVKNAVEKAGGKVDVKSAPGKGTTFEIYVPNEQ